MNLNTWLDVFAVIGMIFCVGAWFYIQHTSRNNMRQIFQLERDYINKKHSNASLKKEDKEQ